MFRSSGVISAASVFVGNEQLLTCHTCYMFYWPFLPVPASHWSNRAQSSVYGQSRQCLFLLSRSDPLSIIDKDILNWHCFAQKGVFLTKWANNLLYTDSQISKFAWLSKLDSWHGAVPLWEDRHFDGCHHQSHSVTIDSDLASTFDGVSIYT